MFEWIYQKDILPTQTWYQLCHNESSLLIKLIQRTGLTPDIDAANYAAFKSNLRSFTMVKNNIQYSSHPKCKYTNLNTLKWMDTNGISPTRQCSTMHSKWLFETLEWLEQKGIKP